MVILLPFYGPTVPDWIMAVTLSWFLCSDMFVYFCFNASLFFSITKYHLISYLPRPNPST